jgi:hypothetical protein
VICTLRGTSTGLVDLTAYCPGSVTPAAKCAAAMGAVCNISQAYDQSGNSRPVVNVTAASQPFLVFSALNGLPAIKCTAASCFLATAATFTISQPITESAVYIVPAQNSAEQVIIGNPNSSTSLGVPANASPNTAMVNAGTEVTATASINAWHALQGLLSGSSCAINVDGTDTGSLNCGTGVWAGYTIRILRGPALQFTGSITETGFLAVTSSSTDRGNIRLNQKATYTSLP